MGGEGLHHGQGGGLGPSVAVVVDGGWRGSLAVVTWSCWKLCEWGEEGRVGGGVGSREADFRVAGWGQRKISVYHHCDHWVGEGAPEDVLSGTQEKEEGVGLGAGRRIWWRGGERGRGGNRKMCKRDAGEGREERGGCKAAGMGR